MSIKLLTEHHLEFLGLKGGCTGSSESTHVKMPHCWKSHVAAHLSLKFQTVFLNLFQTNGFPKILDIIMSGWSLVYIDVSKVLISKTIVFLSLKIDFVRTNSAPFHLGLHCLPKKPFGVSGRQRVYTYTAKAPNIAHLSPFILRWI